MSATPPTRDDILPYTKGLTGVNLWLNDVTSNVLYGSLALIGLSVFLLRCIRLGCNHLRLISTFAISGDKQKFWIYAGGFLPKFKRHLVVAPLIHKRHNRELQISSAVNVGTLPSRLHSLFLSFYILTNVSYCCMLDYHNQPKAAVLAEARGRTGHLAVMNMVLLFVFSARNNPLISFLGIAFDTFNLFHRWVGRLVVIEALAHTFIWGVNNYAVHGLEGLAAHLREDMFLISGMVATIAMVLIVIQSVSVVRHAFYETFLHLHQFLVVIVLIGIITHCQKDSLPQRSVMYVLLSIWFLERFIRLLRMWYRRGATAEVQALDGGACRVTFYVRGRWSKSAGSHVFVYLPSVSLWMSHPFSVARVDRGPYAPDHFLSTAESMESLDDTERDFKSYPKKKTAVSCIIACRTGMTAALYRKARDSPTGVISLKAFVEGPYGGLENLRSYGTVILFAGGVGITHQLSQLRDLISAYGEGRCATRKVVLIWSVRSPEQLNWIKPWLDELLAVSKKGCELEILRYVTRAPPEILDVARCVETATSTGVTVAESTANEARCHRPFCCGRPDVVDLLNRQFKERVGAMSVGVCGPGSLADNVRAATRTLMEAGNVDFWEEAFTW
ncbi:ferric reductase like transmembrane component-domain-containing protein [Amylocarpus encephaloides]|uniref:Ferric reductase like transmembrane component-domain-containing protein n=1 Tax=Amylocarpus encephaloides TaxID=45428 RepID=A0A9P8C2B2_9HELO|nr:ferric reductase like transmembrane component-domain-containing protein [Amylocarpus encephaloides]